MSVTTTTYTQGGNSKLVTISGEIGSIGIIAGVDSAITSLGWSLWDTVGTTTYNPIITKVYRVINADGVTYKYFIIRWDIIKLRFYTSCCESWDAATTHRATNESWTAAGAFAQGYDPQNSYIIVSATTRHIMIWPFINGSPCLWTAVMEFERVATEDIASVSSNPAPCFAWTNSVMIGTPYGQVNNGVSNYMFAFPRQPDGVTGAAAAGNYAPVTNKGMMPYYNSGYNPSITSDTNYLHLGSYYKSLGYKWDTSGLKIPVSPIAVDHSSKSMPFGRAYNFGVIRPIGNQGDTVYANVDITGGWPSSNSATSTNTECFMLPMNGGNETNPLTSWSAGTLYTPGAFNYTYGQLAINNTVQAGKIIPIGDNMWMNTNDGIRTVSISAGNGAISTLKHANPNGILDIVFDGQRTIYGSASNGIMKIDTVTSAVTYTSPAQLTTNGAGYLGIDNKNVYISGRTQTTFAYMCILDQTTFTVSTANIFYSNTTPSVSFSFGTPVPDYLGNVYLMDCPGGQTGAYSKQAWLVNSNTAAITGYVNGGPQGSVAHYGGEAFYFDYITNRLFWCYVQPLSSQLFGARECFQSNIGLLSEGSTATTGCGVSTAYYHCNLNFNNQDYRGDISIVPFRGVYILSQKMPGQTNGSSYPSAGGYLHLISPFNTAGGYGLVGTIVGGSTNTLFYHFLNWGGCLTTDGARIFNTGYYQTGTYYVAMCVTGLYNTTNTQGSSSGRLMLRG